MFAFVRTLLLCIFMYPLNAHSLVILEMKEIGDNIVLTTDGGTVDLTGLSFLYSFSANSDDDSFIDPVSARLWFAPSVDTSLDSYSGITGPTNFGNGFAASSDTHAGDVFGLIGGLGWIAFQQGFSSGDTLGPSTQVWNNETLASLGVTPGTYDWTWAGDAITLNVTEVPIPATLWLFAPALLALTRIKRSESLINRDRINAYFR
jgi:hypothetical protein